MFHHYIMLANQYEPDIFSPVKKELIYDQFTKNLKKSDIAVEIKKNKTANFGAHIKINIYMYFPFPNECAEL